jgi:hypothetical protein
MILEKTLPALQRLERLFGSQLEFRQESHRTHLDLLVVQSASIVRQMLLEATSDKGSGSISACKMIVASTLPDSGEGSVG